MVEIRYELKKSNKENVEKESKIAIECIRMLKRCLVLFIGISSINRFKPILPIKSNEAFYYVQDDIGRKPQPTKPLKETIKINVNPKLCYQDS